MIIEPLIGKPEVFERALDEYGLVLTGKLTPEEFANDPILAINLKHELRMAQARIESQKELLSYQDLGLRDKDRQIEQLMGLIGQAFHAPKPQHFAITVSPIISAVSKVEFDASNSVTGISDNLKRLMEFLEGSGDETAVIEEIRKELQRVDSSDADALKKAPVMDKLRKLIEQISDAEGKIGNVIKTVKQGVATVQRLAKYYNDVAQWCGLPQVPKPFLGREE